MLNFIFITMIAGGRAPLESVVNKFISSTQTRPALQRLHEAAMTWKRLPHYWPLWGESIGCNRFIPLTGPVTPSSDVPFNIGLDKLLKSLGDLRRRDTLWLRCHELQMLQKWIWNVEKFKFKLIGSYRHISKSLQRFNNGKVYQPMVLLSTILNVNYNETLCCAPRTVLQPLRDIKSKHDIWNTIE